MILREAWKKRKIQLGGRIIYFDHNNVSKIVKKHKEYNVIKKSLREMGVHFQTPHTRMQIHWDTGVCTYSTAQELKKHSFPVDELRKRILWRHGLWSGWDGNRQLDVGRRGLLRPRERGDNSRSFREDAPRNQEH